MVKCGFAIALVVLVCLGPAALGQEDDPWRYVDQYAPILQFNSVTVRCFPTAFPREPSGPCAYVHIKPGYVFQYWFYYPEDIRLDRETDQVLKGLLQQGNRLQPALDRNALEEKINKLFHKHDWELLEVRVDKLGAPPSEIFFCAHGARYSLKPGAATMQGKQCVAKVISDMHACYPAGPWTPANSGWTNLNANTEFAITWLREMAAGYHPELGQPPPYHTVNFAGQLRRFSSRMLNVHSLTDYPDYPYPMPWDRGFNY